MLEQPDAQCLSGGGFAEGQVERVQVAGAHVDHAAAVAAGADHFMHAVRLHQAQFMLIAQALQFGHVFLETGKVRRLVGQVAVAPGQVAVDVVLGDPAAYQLHRFQAHQLEFAYPLAAHHRFELVETMPDAADQLPAIATAGTPANLVGFQQGDREAALGQFNGGVQPREAAADHAHIDLYLTSQRRVLQLAVGAGGVVGRGVVGAVHRGVNAGVHV